MFKKTLILLLLIVTLSSFPVWATEQRPDLINFEGKRCELHIHSFLNSPLEYYYPDEQSWPFQSLDTGNYRGFVATWEIRNNCLYLTDIAVENEKLPLDVIFGDKARAGMVFADWFTGMIRVSQKPVLSGDKTDDPLLTYLRVEGGYVKDRCSFTPDQLSNKSMQSNQQHLFYDQYESDHPNRIDQAAMSPDELNRFTPAADYIHGVYQRHFADYQAEKKKERESMAEKCRRTYEQWDGYDLIQNRFTIDHDRSYIGYCNLLPKGISIYMQNKNDALISRVWWHNPVGDDNSVRYNWNDLFEIYQETTTVVSRHPWLLAWLKAEPGRRLMLGVYGKTPCTEGSKETNVDPAWNDAGLKGQPYYQILLYRGELWCGSIYFGKEDSRALILTMHKTYKCGDKADKARNREGFCNLKEVTEEIKTQGGFWLDHFDFCYVPGVPEYIVVEENGEWRMNQRCK